jgi:CO/xanthine dehydrogenase Mo-binding subunit
VNRPVKWVETRQEHLMASTHGSEVIYYGEMAFSKDGTILGLRARAIHDEGAYMRREPIGAFNFIRHATVTYRFRNLEMDVYAVVTNKCPVGPNRSYGKMQQNYLVEVLIDMGARKLGIDPIDIRMKNFVKPEEMPYETPTGALLDGGDYPKILEKACELINYSALRREQMEERKKGKIVGIGIAMGMDAAPINFSANRIINPEAQVSGESEAAWVKVNEDGSIIAAIGTSPQGHGHETAVSQIVAEVLGANPDQVYVVQGFDSWVNPFTPHSGTYASRFGISVAAAVYNAAIRIRNKILQIASHVLNVPIERLDIIDGKIAVDGIKQDLDIKTIAHYAWRDHARLPENMEPGLFAHFVYRTPFTLSKDDKRGNFSLTYSYSACIAYIEVDPDTGFVKLKRVAIVEDCGNQINPLIVEGQIHGQLGHQLGAALYEKLVYDENGQLLTSSFLNYLVPTACELPSYEVDSIITPSLFTPLGTRGMGEGGGAPLIACVNALNDALSVYGIEFTESHLDPIKIRELIKQVLKK